MDSPDPVAIRLIKALAPVLRPAERSGICSSLKALEESLLDMVSLELTKRDYGSASNHLNELELLARYKGILCERS